VIRRIATAIATMLRENPTRDEVHFHAGALGRPYVCEDPRCSSPHLVVSDA
jgi:hypothetical protein